MFGACAPYLNQLLRVYQVATEYVAIVVSHEK